MARLWEKLLDNAKGNNSISKVIEIIIKVEISFNKALNNVPKAYDNKPVVTNKIKTKNVDSLTLFINRYLVIMNRIADARVIIKELTISVPVISREL